VSLSPQEKRATGALASIYSFRMLGLFMLLPVFSLYAEDEYRQVTPFLIGLAVGIYGLTQALFQIPFGLLSDRWGRKPLIYSGLVLFALGGLVAALSESIYGVIAGRALQAVAQLRRRQLLCCLTLLRKKTVPKPWRPLE